MMYFDRPVTQAELDSLVTHVDKPARYTGGEVNAVIKEDGVRGRFALCFADVYEVAESHIGLKILYDIVNRVPDLAAERVYALWPDLESAARDAGVPLWSLETRRPLKMFDLVGFSLQYELAYPTLLGMLEHGGVPLRSADRADADPFVVGGGAGAYNPEPMAPFFDLFFLGDGEDAVVEMLEVVATGRARGASRKEILLELAKVHGVYVPSHYEVSYDGAAIASISAKSGTPREAERSKHGVPRVPRRTVADLDKAPYPTKTIVPNVKPVHDRVAIEIQRGCSQACRFCQAGMITRPTRQRSPEKVLELAQKSLESSGGDEIGLLSLSAGDYEPINEVLSEFFNRYKEDNVAVSLPSMRTESMTPELAQQVASIRKTGFTFAPEAGSERMRKVINKTNTEEDLMAAVRSTVSAGWRHLKFYFMIGLPTETDEDVMAIAHVGERARAEGRKIRPDVNVTVSVSTFVPKPHTSFQWEQQIDVEETKRKHRMLSDRLKPKGIGFRYHTPEQSWLEGVLSRGDRRLADALELAALRGARLDAWSEHYDQALWEECLHEGLAPHGLLPDQYLDERPEDVILPWDHLDAGILKKFLLRDRKKSYAEVTIEDCAFTEHCYACGGCDLGDPYKAKVNGKRPVDLRPVVHEEITEEVQSAEEIRERMLPVISGDETLRSKVRVRFAKLGRAVHMSHLDMMEHVLRGIRIAKIPVSYSEGFSPKPRVGFSPALPTGVESEVEYFEMDVHGAAKPREWAERMRTTMPDGILVLDAQEIPHRSISINNLIASMTYAVAPPEALDVEMVRAAVEAFKASDQVLVRIRRKKKARVIDARSYVNSVDMVGNKIRLKVGFNGGAGTLKTIEAIAAVLGPQAALDSKVYKQSIDLMEETVQPDVAPTPDLSEEQKASVLDLTSLFERKAPTAAPRRGDSVVVPYAE